MNGWQVAPTYPNAKAWYPVYPAQGAQAPLYPGLTYLPATSTAAWQTYPTPLPWAPYAKSAASVASCACNLPGTWVRDCYCGCKCSKPGPFARLAQKWKNHRDHQNALADAKHDRKRAQRKVDALMAQVPATTDSRKRWNLYHDLQDAQEELHLREIDERMLKEKK
jgi:hypothetical protein